MEYIYIAWFPIKFYCTVYQSGTYHKPTGRFCDRVMHLAKSGIKSTSPPNMILFESGSSAQVFSLLNINQLT
jgi:hypothetical protein